MLILDQLKKSDPQLQLLSVSILSGMIILVGGLWYHQIIASNRYRADLKDQSFRSVRVPAIRGKILDRNRVPLAENRPSYNINLYLEDLRNNFRSEYRKVREDYTNSQPRSRITRAVDDELQRMARYRVVSNLLYQVSASVQDPRILLEKDFHRNYLQRRTLPLLLMKDLSFQQVARFVETAPELPSVSLDVQPIRHYPFGPAAAHLLGYLRFDETPDDEDEIAYRFRLPDFKGVKGIELAFDDELRGKPGAKMVLVNNMQYRQSEEMLFESRPGTNVVLTLDITIQQAAERALNGVGTNVRGAVVVMDCNSGDLLAIASAPNYDPNKFVTGWDNAEWERMNDEELRPLFNRALYGQYLPGSIFKIVVGLAGLEQKVIKPDEPFYSPGYFQLGSRGHWKDTAGAGTFDFRKAFAFSSNPYFQNFGLSAGPQKIVELAREIGLGSPTGVSGGMEARGYLPDPNRLRRADGGRWMDGDTANLCIGQGEITVTPLQIAVMTAAVANGGKVLQPRFVLQLEPQRSDGQPAEIRPVAPRIKNVLKVRPENLKIIQDAMLADVEYRDPVTRRQGTGHTAAVKGMRVCGKTGTAQFRGRVHEEITWFVSYAPYENPKYVVVAVVEGGESGGGTCAPIAKQIFEALLKRDQQTSHRQSWIGARARPWMISSKIKPGRMAPTPHV